MKHILACLIALLGTNAQAEVIHIGNEALATLLASGATLVDIRTEPEWKETGIVDGSHLLTFFDEQGRFDARAWADKLGTFARADEPIIVICRTGNRTRAVSDFLDRQAGYKKVYNVKNGIVGWMKDKRPVAPATQALASCKSAGHC